MNDPYAATVSAAAAKWGVPVSLLSAQLQQESGFNPNAVSSAGAEGIAQFMPATAHSIGLANPFDPTTAINSAAELDIVNYNKLGSWPLALAAYNEGESAAASGKMYPQTRNYVSDIMANSGLGGGNSGATWYRGGNGDLNVNFGGTPMAGTSSGAGTCPINDTPILSVWGYALITPCGLWDLAIGIVGLILIIAGFRSDITKTVINAAKAIPLE
jgi:hypothetical protein